MEINGFNGRSCSQIYLIFAILLILLTMQDCHGSPCNRTVAAADCTYRNDGSIDKDGEFLMDSEEHKRLLAQATGQPISYESLQRGPICDASKYGNCITPINEYHRPCNTYNRCSR